MDRQMDHLMADVAELKRALSKMPIRFGHGGGGGGMQFYTADVKANLPEVDAPALGHTTSNGHYYIRSETAWVCISHFEDDA